MRKKFKILGCTLRDGGCYTNWDFSNLLFEKHIKSMSDLPLDYIEIGYINLFNNNYNG
jgi:4-hydroxy 2-oxovalerate aldolase